MDTAKNIKIGRQVERILDQTRSDQVEVIVQMEPDKGTSQKLARAAGEALSRRRLSLSPRDLLPGKYKKSAPKKIEPETASTRAIMGKAAAETLALAAIKEIGLNPLGTLLQSGLVKAALSRMAEPEKKSSPGPDPLRKFWTSRSMPLQFTRDELAKLPKEVKGIKSVHMNRHLNLPNTAETRQAQVETSELLSCTWGLDRVKALSAWGVYDARGKGVKIGILDTGVDAKHPDLEGKVKNWAEFDSLGNQVPGSEPHDTGEHGTHCAGTLTGGNESGRFIGMAPEAELAVGMVIDAGKGGTDAQVLAGIDWAVEQEVDVISMSLGGLVMDPETPPTYTEAILTCRQAGIPIIVAIGNEGEQTSGSPGNDLFALSIGATDPTDRVAGFSGGRTQVIYESDYISEDYLPLPYSKPDISAPGVAVYSSVPGGNWKAMNGTSMATPHVAGSIALLLSATDIKNKEDGANRVYLVHDIICGAVDEMGESGQDHRYGFGLLNVLRAIDFAKVRGY